MTIEEDCGCWFDYESGEVCFCCKEHYEKFMKEGRDWSDYPDSR